MRVDYSMFEGFKVRGNARDVYSRGELIVSGGEFMGKPGRGSICGERRGAGRGSKASRWLLATGERLQAASHPAAPKNSAAICR